MRSLETVSASQFKAEQLTFKNLNCQYRTGRTLKVEGRGSGKTILYRYGIQTKLGDFEVHEWMELVRSLIRQAGEEDLQSRLLHFVNTQMPWLHSDFERQLEALQLHARRIFEDPSWVNYRNFNEEAAHECESK